MNSRKIISEAPGGKRIPLSQLVPLDTPLLVQIFPIYACNFVCKYCVFSMKKSKRGFISDKIKMDFNLYKKCVDDMCKFPNKIKVLRFVGMGEPLLHNQLPEMIQYASSKNIINKIEILTNASLLTPRLSDKIIASGLSKLLISIQGTSEKKYMDISNVKINFQKFIENIKYFYDHRNNVEVHIKIIDCALGGKEDEQKFYDLFGNICNTIGIEYAGPIFPGVEYNKVLKNTITKTQFGLNYTNIKICPQPFFSMQINPDGKIVPCYSIVYPEILGDCNNESLYDIWNGSKYNNFRYKMLDGIENSCNVCQECDIVKHRMFATDDLSNDIERLKKAYG